MIEINEAIIHLTEQTLRELLSAVEKAKKDMTFTTELYPKGDMSVETKIKLDRERGKILVESPWSKEKFLISVEINPNTQESLGYKLHESPKISHSVEQKNWTKLK